MARTRLLSSFVLRFHHVQRCITITASYQALSKGTGRTNQVCGFCRGRTSRCNILPQNVLYICNTDRGTPTELVGHIHGGGEHVSRFGYVNSRIYDADSNICLVKRFAVDIVGPKVREMDEKESMDPTIIQGLFEQGVSIQAAVFPERTDTTL